MKTIELKYPLSEFKKIAHKWFYLEDDRFIDITVATYVANKKFDGDPLWMLLIAPPSNTKTEILRAFKGHKDAYFISNMTPSTLVSGIKAKKGQPEPSLLPKLDNKMVILKDFTSILSMRSENQQEILAQLREAYDGQYSKSFGNGKEINWHGRFGLIGACTPSYDSHYGVIGKMGERFLLYRTDSINGQKMGLQAQKIVGQEEAMRLEIQNALHKFINQFKQVKADEINFEMESDVGDMIVALACFVTYGRCPVERDRINQSVKYKPMAEGTARLVKQLTQLAMGLALTYGKIKIDQQVYATVKKAGRDLIPVNRLEIIQFLWNEKAAEPFAWWSTTSEVAQGVNTPTTTAKLLLEDLMIIGALNRDREDESERSPYRWQVAQQMCEWIGNAELFA